ncbi:LpxK domain-containing protein [Cephalotus follicularis]|uniref:tetraacyldisaccharide 4'-kinase n=1 Tax=Cephalotus follicularis TaxID=3775 RepID=A0A1Q3BY22_CEPFO|nr:LpxK domain-containing protein [Cephalotus follicularis]
MDKLKRTVKEIAYAQDHRSLPALHRCLIPLLSIASSLYTLALSLRHYLYRHSLFSPQRLPVVVISVGNLTWGGNGKTPMVEYIARCLADSGISPLILTRGYAGGDEAKMLQRHLLGKPVNIGVGANRAATAACFFKKYGYIDRGNAFLKRNSTEKIGAAILDDGMQHWSLCRDLEVLMVNGLMQWGNCQLLPLGPLREPLMALRRADVAVVHHADLMSKQNLEYIELMMRNVKESLPIYYTKMAPSHLFEVENINSRVPLGAVFGAVVLCVSAIGSASAFVERIEKMGASYVDRLDFDDHHFFEAKDIEMIRSRLGELEEKFCSKPIVVVTEKDFDRDPEILKHFDPFTVFALCSELQIIPHNVCNEDSFKKLLKEILSVIS